MRRRLWIIAGLLILLSLLACAGAYVYFENAVRPRLLRAAGAIDLSPLTTDIPAGILLPPATGPGNAARDYVAAANLYNLRRLPLLRKRGLDPFVREPSIGAPELRLLMHAAWQRTCDFYAREPGRPPLALRNLPGGRTWSFRAASDPFLARPYIGPMRLLGQAALDWGKARERQRQWLAAETAYLAILRMGAHLGQNPGSLMDVQLGIELQLKGLHYLEWMAMKTHSPGLRRRCWRYGDAVNRLAARVRRKFAQLDNPEAAMRILRRDGDRLWRIEAAVALDTTMHFHPPGWLERFHIEAALRAARRDPDPAVRAAVALLARMPEKAFRQAD